MTDGGQIEAEEYEPTKYEEWTLLEVEWDCITRRAKARFMDQWDEREDWKTFEARYHVYKAQDQLSVASYHSRQDDADELVKTNIADAVNHMLMAMATLDVDHDECQPIQSEDEIVTDGGQCVDGTERFRQRSVGSGGSICPRTKKKKLNANDLRFHFFTSDSVTTGSPSSHTPSSETCNAIIGGLSVILQKLSPNLGGEPA